MSMSMSSLARLVAIPRTLPFTAPCGRLLPVVAADGAAAANLGIVSGTSILM
jgi:hypothetical protein